MTNPLGGGGIRTPEEIAERFTIAGRETEAIKQLTGCVEQQLSTLTPTEVRAALEYRRPGQEAQ